MNKAKAEPENEATLVQAHTVEPEIFMGTSIFDR